MFAEECYRASLPIAEEALVEVSEMLRPVSEHSIVGYMRYRLIFQTVDDAVVAKPCNQLCTAVKNGFGQFSLLHTGNVENSQGRSYEATTTIAHVDGVYQSLSTIAIVTAAR